MNDIRINKEEEKIIYEGKFKLPILVIVLFALCMIPLFTYMIIGFASGSIALGVTLLITLLIYIGLFILYVFVVNKSILVISDKRIYGVKPFWLILINFTLRLDTIDNVRLTRFLGASLLTLSFSSSFNNHNIKLRLPFLENYETVYAISINLLNEKKNDKDALIDSLIKNSEEIKVINNNLEKAIFRADVILKEKGIDVEKLNKECEEKKRVEEEIKDKINKVKYLLDENLITEEEFNKKKQEIIDSYKK